MASKIELLKRAYPHFYIGKGDTMKSISSTDEEVIVARFEGETIAQIAEELGVTASAVNTRLNRILYKAKQLFA